LRDEIARGQVLAIIGAGVSIGATGNARAASWTGLLHDGVDFCVGQNQTTRWAERARGDIEDGDLLAAAEKISSVLRAPSGGPFRTWLRESVGALEAKDLSVLETLRDLKIPLATTNYDSLLEEVTGLPPVTWRDGSRIERVIRGDEDGIFHIHGHWDDPGSVVLGIRSYEKVQQDPHTQAVLAALRTLRTLVFIGCGDGLADPNFGPFLTWTRQVFGVATEYPHYQLCRAGEEAGLRPQHPADEPIVLLAYGPDHSDLVPFLRSLIKAPTSPVPPVPAHTVSRLPPLPRYFGRDIEVEALVTAVCADSPRPVPVLGPGGVGKTTVTLAALHDRRVAERFRERRWFVRCDGATSADALLGEIAKGVGVEPRSQLEERVFREIERVPGVLALDNAETPWEGDLEKVEALLAQLGGLAGLALVASIRGDERPLGPAWTEAVRVGPLAPSDARDAFLAVAGDHFRNDPVLDHLLEAVDGLPLAVTLLACQAQADPDLSVLWSRWQKERTAALRRGDGAGRLLNLEVSLEISVHGPRMTDEARRLLSLLGLLPDGIAHEDLEALLLEVGEAGAATLRRVGLAFSQGARLRVLAPVREHAARQYPPSTHDLESARRHYLELAMRGDEVGRKDGSGAVCRLEPETSNLEAMVLRTLEGPEPMEAMAGVKGLKRLFVFTGLGAPSVVERALSSALAIRDERQQARCKEWLGEIELGRSDHDTARYRYEEAFALYQRIGDVLGEAECIRNLGQIALERSDHDVARASFQEALTLYRRVGNVLGEAECIESLGDIALERLDYNVARACYGEALPLYRRTGDILGEANCIQGLGDIAFRDSDYDMARAHYEKALPVYSRVGDVLGKAYCIKNLGDIALRCSDHDRAHACFAEARPLFHRVGDVLGEANCIRSLGDLALEQGAEGLARSRFVEALDLYTRIQEPYSIGWTRFYLARIAEDSEERRRHIAAAREAWTRIKRQDLVDMLEQEFRSPEEGPTHPDPSGSHGSPSG
jgi:tetratricopeptide (TPR) repeat protein